MVTKARPTYETVVTVVKVVTVVIVVRVVTVLTVMTVLTVVTGVTKKTFSQKKNFLSIIFLKFFFAHKKSPKNSTNQIVMKLKKVKV